MSLKEPACVLAVIFLPFVLVPGVAFSSDAEPVWVGKIIMDYRSSSSLFEDASDGKSTSTHEMHEEAGVTVVIKACGLFAQNLRIGQPQVNYMMKESRSTQMRGSACSGSENYEANLGGVWNPQFPDFISQSTLSVDPASKSYTLSVSLGDAPAILVTGSSHSVKKHPDTKIENIGSPGEKKYSCELITFTNDIAYDLLTTEPSSGCDRSGRQCAAKFPASERMVPLRASCRGKYDGGKTIRGEVFYPDSRSIYGADLPAVAENMDGLFEFMKEMGKQSPGLQRELAEAEAEMRRARAPGGDGEKEDEPGQDPRTRKVETLRVNWEFDRVDECEDILEDLKQNVSVLRAYADDGILEKAAAQGIDGTHEGDGRLYDDMVGREGYLQYTSHWWGQDDHPPEEDFGMTPDPQGAASPDMWTDDEKCEVRDYEKVKTEYEKKCYPGILLKSIHEHEKVHVRQCQDPATSADFKSGTPRSYRKYELEAHCFGIGIVLDYAKKHCQDGNLSPFEKEHQRICGDH